MKICLIIRGFSPSWGGAERISVNLALRLSDAGHDVHVLTAKADAIYEGIRIIILPVTTFLSPCKILSFQRQARRIIDNEHFDFVYGLTQVYPVDIYRVGGGLQCHWMRVLYPNPALRSIKYMTSLVHPAMRMIEDRLFRPNDRRFFITNCRLIRDQIIHYYHIPEKRIRVVYNGVDTEIFNSGVKHYRIEMRGRYNIGNDEFVILFAANNWERKGLATLINAVAQLPGQNNRLLVTGRGKEKPYLALARRLNLKSNTIVFVGHAKEIEKHYGMSDIFVLPSRYEPFSNVCLEAMACGLPVITTKTNGASELIAPGINGFVLDDWKDSKGLAGMIQDLSDDFRRKEIGEHASETAKHYTWERHMEETEELFNLLMDENNRMNTLLE